MDRPVYIYGLYEGDELHYIGQTADPDARLQSHLAEARQGAPTARTAWIRDVLAKGGQVRLAVLATTDKANGDRVEREHIARHAATGLLANTTHNDQRRPARYECERADLDGEEGVLTVPQAAATFGYTERSIRLAIRRGLLTAHQVGPLYTVRSQDVQAYIDAKRPGPGRPRGPRRPASEEQP